MKREKFVPTPEYRKFISKLRLARMEAGVSQRELSRRLGWHWTRVIRSENCERALDIIEVRAICEALQISVVDFTRELDQALNAMEADAANPANVDAPTDENGPSTTPPSSPS